MRTLVAIVGCGLIGVLIVTQATPQEKETPPGKAQASSSKELDTSKIPKVTEQEPMSFWMEKKLDFSKSILESLTKGDFEQLAEDADQMRRLGKIEGFVRRKNEDYRIQLRTFDFATQELVRNAKRENAEGAALAFNQLTTSCVACHVMLREGIE